MRFFWCGGVAGVIDWEIQFLFGNVIEPLEDTNTREKERERELNHRIATKVYQRILETYL